MKVVIGGLAALALALSLAVGLAQAPSSERASVGAPSAQATDVIDWP
ncbi:hypothetical protein ABZT04_16115 [Streptomyces sp. NPDC005492]